MAKPASSINWVHLSPSFIKDGLFFIVFLSVICSQIWSINYVIADKDLSENNNPVTKSKFHIESLSDFPSAFDGYFRYHFPLRSFLIDKYYFLRRQILRESVFESVLVGKDNWLYYTGEKNLDYYQRLDTFTPKELEKIYRTLKRYNSVLSEDGIFFLIVFSPSKETIYPEFLPDYVVQYKRKSRMDQVVDSLSLDSRLAFVDLRQPLLKSKETQLVYFHTDTHWNDIGAFIAYREIIKILQDKFPAMKPHALDEYEASTKEYLGDLSNFLLGHIPSETVVFLSPRFETRVTVIPTDPPYPFLYISEVEDPSLPRCVMFSDSFGLGLLPFLSPHFSRLHFGGSPLVHLPLVIDEQPEVVILQLNERNLGLLLEQPEL